MNKILYVFLITINTAFAQSAVKAPRILVNEFKQEVAENEYINCRKVTDMGVIVFLSPEYEKYDAIKVEFHRFGPSNDVVVGFKTFIPSSKEYQKKLAGKDSVKLKLLVKEITASTSDFELNSLDFPPTDYIIDIYCNVHLADKNNFYVIVRGYMKAGQNNFGEDIFNAGVDLSPKSVWFRNWDFTTK